MGTSCSEVAVGDGLITEGFGFSRQGQVQLQQTRETKRNPSNTLYTNCAEFAAAAAMCRTSRYRNHKHVTFHCGLIWNTLFC